VNGNSPSTLLTESIGSSLYAWVLQLRLPLKAFSCRKERTQPVYSDVRFRFWASIRMKGSLVFGKDCFVALQFFIDLIGDQLGLRIARLGLTNKYPQARGFLCAVHVRTA